MRVPAFLDRSASRLPKRVRTVLDWVVTVAIAAGGVFIFQAEVAKPFRIPTASMEPTLHCAKPGPRCKARLSDRDGHSYVRTPAQRGSQSGVWRVPAGSYFVFVVGDNRNASCDSRTGAPFLEAA